MAIPENVKPKSVGDRRGAYAKPEVLAKIVKPLRLPECVSIACKAAHVSRTTTIRASDKQHDFQTLALPALGT
ncbi:MAG TPA: hypothetical protein VIU14_00350, partial [Mesorhizobium sp.]